MKIPISKTAPSAPFRSATIELQPQFYDVDPMGVVWHGNYFRFLECARSALLDSFHYGYLEMEKSGYFWPIVETRMKYVSPVALGQKITVTAILVEWENRLRIDYEIFNLATRRRATKAQTTQIAIDKHSREMCFTSPAILFEKLGLSQK
ncbi:MAG: acyl-CoA thioesterase [Puniceicoccales bacterium]|jgi:acyl-CoA thioester hydrolase|nr:acyl-CoA thioesterase [Puniceicoccales bacterium]